MARPRSWTDEQLRAAVALSSTWVEVLQRLGLTTGGATLAAVRRRVVHLGIEAPQLARGSAREWSADPGTVATSPAKGHRTWDDDDLAQAVAAARSVAGVIRHLGLTLGGSVYITIKRRIAQLGLDDRHFTARDGARGS